VPVANPSLASYDLSIPVASAGSPANKSPEKHLFFGASFLGSPVDFHLYKCDNFRIAARNWKMQRQEEASEPLQWILRRDA
jgi:hypothetical protein